VNPIDSIKNQVIGKLKIARKQSDNQEENKKEPNEKISVEEQNYLLFGEVMIRNTNSKKTETDFLVQNMQNQEQIQPQPDLFDIDDDTPPKIPQKSDNKENKLKIKKPTKSYSTLPMKTIKLHKGEKENQKVKLMNMLKIKLTRYLGFHEGSLISGEKTKTDLKIKSKTPLDRLFQIYIEKENPKRITLLFFNKELNPCMPPQRKTYDVDKPQIFIHELIEQLFKLGAELKLQHTPSFQF